MDRVLISKRVLDRLIRAKLEQIHECTGVNALPVVVKRRAGRGCNWAIPGWTGESNLVLGCSEKMKTYLEFLRGQFDVSES